MDWYGWDYDMENWENKDMDEWGLVHIGWGDLEVNVVVVVYGFYRAQFLYRLWQKYFVSFDYMAVGKNFSYYLIYFIVSIWSNWLLCFWLTYF